MKRLFQNFFWSLPLAARLFVSVFAIGYPLAQLGLRCHLFDAYQPLALMAPLVGKGQVWRVITYAFLPGCIAEWVVNLFWLATLASVVARNWRGPGFWGYCLLGAAAGAVPFLIAGSAGLVLGPQAMTLALLVAWERLFGNERILLLGLGELSVRQTAILVAIVNSVITLFLSGWLFLASMWCGGLAGWLYFVVHQWKVLRRPANAAPNSERIARLEL